jgi:hypothetical protein
MLERTDPGRQVECPVDVACGIGDGDGVEEVELPARRLVISCPAASATGRSARPSTPVPPVTSSRIRDGCRASSHCVD